MISKTLTASILAASIAFSGSALAIPGAGTKSKTEPPKAGDKMQPMTKKKQPSAKKLNCKRGETAKLYKNKGKSAYRCVKLKADVLPDSELYQQARLLADQGEYEWALDHLRLIRDQQDAEVLNYTGYANRKAGRLETGIAYYQQALALNPNYVQAREYLGEAYVLAGFDNLAKQQLEEIAKRGGTSTEAYHSLQKFILERQTQ